MSMKISITEAFAKIRALFEEAFTNAKCSDGTILKWSGELKEGTPIMLIGADGAETPAEDKTYEVEDGSKITTVGGLVTAVEAKADPGKDNPADMTKAAEELKAAQTLLKKFADPATPIDSANLSIMMKAVMQYCFGWEMEKAGRDEAVAAAIAAYKTGFAEIEKLVTAQDEVVRGYEAKFTAIEKAVTDSATSSTEKFEAIKTLMAEISTEPAAQPIPQPGRFAKKKKSDLTPAEKMAKVMADKKKNS